MDVLIDQALLEAEKQGIKGADVTPFILGKINQLSSGTSLQANLALLLSNARLAAQIAVAIQPPTNHVV
jgi:pseudouridine-5'-phosphate glycosidase